MIMIYHQHVYNYSFKQTVQFLKKYVYHLESNEIFCSSSTSYPTSTANFPISAHASGRYERKHVTINEFILLDYYASNPYSSDWRYSSFSNFSK